MHYTEMTCCAYHAADLSWTMTCSTCGEGLEFAWACARVFLSMSYPTAPRGELTTLAALSTGTACPILSQMSMWDVMPALRGCQALAVCVPADHHHQAIGVILVCMPSAAHRSYAALCVSPCAILSDHSDGKTEGCAQYHWPCQTNVKSCHAEQQSRHDMQC